MRLRLDSLAAGGDAVGRAEDGRVVFVDGGAPGDLVELELTEQKAKFARGRVVAVIEPGAARVIPPCVLAERCGGCPWQMVSEPAQREAKTAIVARALSRTGVAIDPLVAAPAALGYRVRASLHARGGALGFYARKSHALVAVEHCPALVPALDLAVQAARRAVGGALGEEGTLRATIAPSGEVQLALEPGRGADRARLSAIASALVGDSGIVGVLVERESYGAALIDVGDAGSPHLVSAAGFRQANAQQNDRLRALVQAGLQSGGARVVELYAGDGNFTRDLGNAKSVLAVEEDAAAVARLRKNVPSAEAVCGRVEVELVKRRGERFDRVLLDPPRAGAKPAMSAIVATQASRIVYVSCDPATLARDAAVLSAGGYTIERATPLEMMPHTDHIEVVLVATR